MLLVIDRHGQVRCLYSEAIPLAELGSMHIQRASYVEPDDGGQWWADLAPASGPRLGPFTLRSLALDAERVWLESYGLTNPQPLAR